MLGVLDACMHPALLQEADDGLVVEVQFGVDVLSQRLAATLTRDLTGAVAADQVANLTTGAQSVNRNNTKYTQLLLETLAEMCELFNRGK